MPAFLCAPQRGAVSVAVTQSRRFVEKQAASRNGAGVPKGSRSMISKLLSASPHWHFSSKQCNSWGYWVLYFFLSIQGSPFPIAHRGIKTHFIWDAKPVYLMLKERLDTCIQGHLLKNTLLPPPRYPCLVSLQDYRRLRPMKAENLNYHQGQVPPPWLCFLW